MRIILLFLLSLPIALHAQPALKTEHVILITLDGFRWQELFGGADSSLVRQQKLLKDAAIMEKYWRPRAEDRRQLLMPFLWTTIASKGVLLGNRALGSKVNVTNNQWFSYPGYNEILTGYADNERIHSNDKLYNPNKTVLEFLNNQPAFKGKVAAYASWDVFSYIINDTRSGVWVSAGLKEATGDNVSIQEQTLNRLMGAVPNPLGDVRLDAFTFYYGLEYMKRNKPRVMYFAFDETDDFAHQGEYAAYLNSARNTDRFIAELYAYLQSETFYKDKTTIIITVDHGRGNGPEDWKHHGIKIKDADQIWMAVIGPDTPALGEVKTEGQYHQHQVAQTINSLLGLHMESEKPQGKPLDVVLKK